MMIEMKIFDRQFKTRAGCDRSVTLARCSRVVAKPKPNHDDESKREPTNAGAFFKLEGPRGVAGIWHEHLPTSGA